MFVKLSHSLKDSKLTKRNALYMKGTKRDPKNFKPSSLLPKDLQNYRNNTRTNYELFNGKQHSLQIQSFTNLYFARTTEQTLLFHT